MDEHAADSNPSRRLELDSRGDFVGVGLLQAGIDGRDRSAEARQLGTFFTGLKRAVAVSVNPVVGRAAQIVLIRTGDESGAGGVVVP
jgi:hypothetical protein